MRRGLAYYNNFVVLHPMDFTQVQSCIWNKQPINAITTMHATSPWQTASLTMTERLGWTTVMARWLLDTRLNTLACILEILLRPRHVGGQRWASGVDLSVYLRVGTALPTGPVTMSQSAGWIIWTWSACWHTAFTPPIYLWIHPDN